MAVVSPETAYEVNEGTFVHQASVEEFIIVQKTKKVGVNTISYMYMDKETQFRAKEEIINSTKMGIRKHTIAEITDKILIAKPENYEGSIEIDAEEGTIEYKYRVYDNLAIFYIMKNKVDIVRYLGNKEVTWKFLQKIQEIAKR